MVEQGQDCSGSRSGHGLLQRHLSSLLLFASLLATAAGSSSEAPSEDVLGSRDLSHLTDMTGAQVVSNPGSRDDVQRTGVAHRSQVRSTMVQARADVEAILQQSPVEASLPNLNDSSLISSSSSEYESPLI